MSEESPRPVTPLRASDLDAFLLEFPSEEVTPAESAVEPRVETPTVLALAPEPAPATPIADVPVHVEPVAAPIARSEAVHRPATVTEFPVHVTRPPTSNVPALIPDDITLLELLERQGGLDWRRAVSVVHEICRQLKGYGSHSPILLEARNIVVTNEGEVRLLPSQPGGDPLVIQLGRLLRTLLRGNEAPPELRLLLAQATFELPIFESVDDVEKALQQLERLEESSGNGHSFAKSVVLPRPIDTQSVPDGPTHKVRPMIPKASSQGRRRKSGGNGVGLRYGLQVALAVIVIAVASGLFLNQAGWLWPEAPSAAPTTVATTGGEPAASGAAILPERPVPESATIPTSGTNGAPPQAPRGPQNHATPGTRLHEPARPERPRTFDTPPVGTTPSARINIAPSAPVPTPRVFDSVLHANPLYEPKPTELTPEAMATFRTTQRQLLPSIAQRDYDRGRAALSAGDPDRALILGQQAIAILDRRLTEPNSQLREQVVGLLEEAALASAAADEIVYSSSDRGIIPPRELSRQFPATSPIGVPPHRVGTLEMIIDKQGGVEFVKLHTPLNRYHERMIVSAAKAWRYRPATRNGRPVRFRVTVRINLPESGTD